MRHGAPVQMALRPRGGVANTPAGPEAGESRFTDPNRRHTHPQRAPDWNNLQVLHRNTLPPRSYFFLYNSEKDALAGDISRSRCQLLSGKAWKFHLSPSPFQGPGGFYERSFDASEWADVHVPGMWQCQGFGKGPQYTNLDFPWPADPPHVPLDDNECGRYLTVFHVPKSAQGSQLRLRFEGVDSAFTVWVNGKEIGYSQGARNPSEFDVTDAVEIGWDNTLAVEVYQRCDGTYLEDQDQWWLSGIFRDVYLHTFPKKAAFEDFHVQTLLDDNYKNAELSVKVKLNGDASVGLKLLDRKGGLVASGSASSKHGSVDFQIPVKNPHKWTAETPYLYSLVLSVDGSVFACQKVGFRRTGLVDGVFCINGQPVKLRGVNRHEHHPDSGRAVPYEWLKHDLLLMKLHNVNAIRTSHYINDPRLYELANELGLWILDEADLECHGLGVIGGDASKWATDNPDWTEAYVDRARQMVMRDKNQPCVVLWSLGNESFYGRNHQAMYDFIKSVDTTRLVHYEGDYGAQTADIFSRMYTSQEDIINMARDEKWDKPLVMCEYIHAMGNGPGGIKEYVEAFYKYPRLMGGFVWEWANHGLRTKNEDGEEYMAYGGDFGDDPNDGHFVFDGLCFATHTPTPGLVEYKKAIEPVQTLGIQGDKVTIINRYDFRSLDHLRCTWRVVSDGEVVEGGEVAIPKGIRPHTKAKLSVEGLFYPQGGECWLILSFTLRESANWATAGHEVAFGQLQLQKPSSLVRCLSLAVPQDLRPQVELTSPCHLSIKGKSGSAWVFDLSLGTLTSWRRPEFSGNLITEPLSFALYRALTDNDRGGRFGQDWRSRRLHQIKTHVLETSWEEQDSGITEIVVTSRVAAPVLNWSVLAVTTFRFSGRDLHIKVKARPQGMLLPNTFSRFGLKLGLAGVESVGWFGRGPGESYRDKKLSQRFGNWDSTVDGLFVDYDYPQDSGNRTDVRWVEFRGTPTPSSYPSGAGSTCADARSRLLRARFGDLDGASFQALHYTAEDLDIAQHPYELYRRKREDTIVHLDWVHHGIGTGSCGPATLPQYELRTDQEFNVEILLD